MRKPTKRLTEVFFATSLLLVATTTHARLERGPLKPRDNVKECRDSVQKELASIDKKWGRVQFDCQLGYVRSLYLPAGSLADREINRFVKRYWRLFDDDKVSLADAGYPWQTSIFKRAGLPVHAGTIDSGQGPGPRGDKLAFYELAPAFEIPAGFSVKPRIPKDQAISKAVGISAKRGHSPNHVEGTELIIRDECLNLKEFEVKPELVWWIRIRESGNKKLVSCFIDAVTGEACTRNGCSSSNDAFSL